ncbi:MAG TPA: TolC family protein [Spirochaetota bacterium]|nr:TolC family protein [Spirochaetota bacterium]
MNKFILTIGFLFSIFLFTTNAGALETSDLSGDKTLKLTVDEAVDLALKNNLGLESERLKLEQKKWAMYTSWNPLIPSTKLSFSLARLNERKSISATVPFDNPMDPMDTASIPDVGTMYSNVLKTDPIDMPEWGASLSFDTTFVLNAYIVFSIYNSVLDYNSGKINIEIAEKKIERDVRKNYYNLLLIRQNTELLKESVKAAENRYNQAVANYKNGLVPEYTMLAAQVAYENMKPAVLEIENGYFLAALSFKQTLGLKSEVELNFVNGMDTPVVREFNCDELIEKYIDNRLDVQSLYRSMNILKNVRNITIASMTPTFMFRASVDPTFQKDAGKDAWFGDSTYMNDNWKQNSGMLMFSFSLPLDYYFPFSSKQMDLVNNNYQLKQTEIAMRQLKNGAELEIKSLVLKLQKSINSLNTLRMTYELAQKTYNLAEIAYKAGSKELLEVQNSELEYKKAKNNILQEEYNYTTALLDLEYALNTKLR